jgi:hypothetical protein
VTVVTIFFRSPKADQRAECFHVKDDNVRPFLLSQLARDGALFAIAGFGGQAYGIKSTGATTYSRTPLPPGHEYTLYAHFKEPTDASKSDHPDEKPVARRSSADQRPAGNILEQLDLL